MSDLSPQLQELVIAGRNATRPTEADLDRILGLLQGRFAAAASGGEVVSAQSKAGVTRLISGKAATITAVGVALFIGGVGLHRLHSRDRGSEQRVLAESTVPITAQPVASIRPVLSTPAEQERSPATSSSGPSSNQKAPSVASSREVSRVRDSLSEEVAILSRAETELHSGRAESALKTLNEHERKFPRGILTEERIAARIQALCALGRGAEANALLVRLKPGSLHGEASRQACASNGANR